MVRCARAVPQRTHRVLGPSRRGYLRWRIKSGGDRVPTEHLSGDCRDQGTYCTFKRRGFRVPPVSVLVELLKAATWGKPASLICDRFQA